MDNMCQMTQNNQLPLRLLTIPIFFLADNMKYIELTTNCSGCGYGVDIILFAKNVCRKVVGYKNRWRN
jgi:hypothetical protein